MLSPRHDKVVTAPPAMGHHSTPPRQKILLKKELLALTQQGLEALLSMIFWRYSTTVNLATLSASHLVPWRGKCTWARASSPLPSMASTLPSPNLV